MKNVLKIGIASRAEMKARTLKTTQRYGFVEIRKDAKGRMVVIAAPHDGYRVEYGLSRKVAWRPLGKSASCGVSPCAR